MASRSLSSFLCGFLLLDCSRILASSVEEADFVSHHLRQRIASHAFLKLSGSDDLQSLVLDDPDKGNPPIIGDHYKATWDSLSKFSSSTAAIIACLWVTMVAAGPLIVVYHEGQKLTRTQKTMCGLMWFAFFGGIFLFTRVILFQSVHFTQVRNLNITEAVYFLAQVLTTVGYGDITPARPRGQIFVGLYVVFSVMVIANIVSEAVTLVAQHSKEYAARLRRLRSAKRMEELESPSTSEAARTQEPTRSHAVQKVLGKHQQPPLDFGNMIKSATAFLGCCTAGVVFFTNFPGEEKTLLEACYMSIITLSTVGFGAITPNTEEGRVFAAFWMVFGSSSLVALCTALTELIEQIKIRERWDPDHARQQYDNFTEGLKEQNNKYEFVRHVILHQGILAEQDFEDVEELFEMCTPRELSESNPIDLSKRLSNPTASFNKLATGLANNKPLA